MSQIRREDLRRAIRAYLYDRIGTALSTASITRGLKREWNATEDEVRGTLVYLNTTDPKQVDATHDDDGATKYYSINAAGVKAHERHGI